MVDKVYTFIINYMFNTVLRSSPRVQSSSNWRSSSRSRALTSWRVLMNVYREKIMYNFRNQTYWDLWIPNTFVHAHSSSILFLSPPASTLVNINRHSICVTC
ncbi:hypothetical protein PUN28_016013 [Cardiocondyla obscurior]|uniref:Uncharacterized protein n=1 Tax=Cardiocondyla obscurior TaxID=286306 RepID=A0AAW2ERP9_9HYME